MRYHFDLDDGVDILEDTQGNELDTPAEARLVAIRFLLETVAHEVPQDGRQRSFTVRMKDDVHRVLLQVSIAYEEAAIR